MTGDDYATRYLRQTPTENEGLHGTTIITPGRGVWRRLTTYSNTHTLPSVMIARFRYYRRKKCLCIIHHTSRAASRRKRYRKRIIIFEDGSNYKAAMLNCIITEMYINREITLSFVFNSPLSVVRWTKAATTYTFDLFADVCFLLIEHECEKI